MPWQAHIQRATMTLTDFLRARLNEDEARGGCGGPDRACDALSARALAEVEAKRHMMNVHAPVSATGREESCVEDGGPWPCATVRILALPYVDHPDFRQEWRP